MRVHEVEDETKVKDKAKDKIKDKNGADNFLFTYFISSLR